jgi:hypothetical protein
MVMRKIERDKFGLCFGGKVVISYSGLVSCEEGSEGLVLTLSKELSPSFYM